MDDVRNEVGQNRVERDRADADDSTNLPEKRAAEEKVLQDERDADLKKANDRYVKDKADAATAYAADQAKAKQDARERLAGQAASTYSVGGVDLSGGSARLLGSHLATDADATAEADADLTTARTAFQKKEGTLAGQLAEAKGTVNRTYDAKGRKLAVEDAEESNRHDAARRAADDLDADAADIAARRAGRTEEADLDAFNRKGKDRIAAAEDRLNVAKASGKKEDIDDATRDVGSTKADVAAQDAEKADELARNRARERAESADKVKDEEVAAEAAADEAKGNLYDADTIRFKRAQDDKVEHLKNAQKRVVENSPEWKNLQDEIKATEGANAAQSGARDAEHAREDSDATADVKARTQESRYRDVGDNYDATRLELQRAAERDFEKLKAEGASPERVKARQDQFTEDQASARHQEERKYDRMRDGAADTLLRAAGRGGEADVLDIRRDVAEQERAVSKADPKLAAAEIAGIKADGLVRLAAVQESMKPQAQFGLSNSAYYQQLQEKAVSGQHQNDALAAANKLKGDIAGSDAKNPLAAPDLKDALSHLDSSSAALRDAAKALENTKQLYVV